MATISANIYIDIEIETLEGYGDGIQKIKGSLESSLKSDALNSPVVAALSDDVEWPAFDAAGERYRLRSWVEAQREQAAVNAYRDEADRAVARGDLAAAEASLRSAHALVPDDLSVSMQLAQLLRDRGEFKKAEPLLHKITMTHRNYAPAWRELGVAQHKLKKAIDAVKNLSQAVELDSFDVDALGSLGGALKSLGQFGEAQDAYLRALELNPYDPYPLLNYISMYVTNNRALPNMADFRDATDKAESTCLVEVATGRRTPWCHFDLAQLAFLKGDMESFQSLATEAAKAATARWQTDTAIKTYELFRDAKVRLEDSEKAAQYLRREADRFLPIV